MNEIEKKYINFIGKLGKLASNLEDEYYKNGGNAQIQKMYDNFR